MNDLHKPLPGNGPQPGQKSGLPGGLKKKWPRAVAIEVARELTTALRPAAERLVVAGSLRRRKDRVGDVEILYVPKFLPVPTLDFFAAPPLLNHVDMILDQLLIARVIEPRLNSLGSTVWGAKNKLAVHVATGLPVDLFQATAENWWNYLVCRTGSAEHNIAVCTAAEQKGWKWNPYGAGFTDASGQSVPVHSERDVFDFVGLPYLEPWER